MYIIYVKDCTLVLGLVNPTVLHLKDGNSLFAIYKDSKQAKQFVPELGSSQTNNHDQSTNITRGGLTI
jgi:hypothetical protein